MCLVENTDDQKVECYLPSVSGLICRIEPEHEDVSEGVFFVLFYNLHCLCPFAFGCAMSPHSLTWIRMSRWLAGHTVVRFYYWPDHSYDVDGAHDHNYP